MEGGIQCPGSEYVVGTTEFPTTAPISPSASPTTGAPTISSGEVPTNVPTMSSGYSFRSVLVLFVTTVAISVIVAAAAL